MEPRHSNDHLCPGHIHRPSYAGDGCDECDELFLVEKAGKVKPNSWHVFLYKVRSTWYWTTHNPQGGSFGSNHCGSKRDALARALHGLSYGTVYHLTVNEKYTGTVVKR